MKKVRVQASRRKIQTDSGEVAERISNFEYDFNSRRSKRWYDGRRDSGSVQETKSTFVKIGQKYKASGRFRINKSHHMKLLDYDRRNTAYYIFVLFAIPPETAYLKRLKPAKVGNLIGSMGGFTKSGHKNIDEEKKLPWSAVFDKSKIK